MHARRGGAHRRPSRRVVAGLLAVLAVASVVSIALVGPPATAKTQPVPSTETYGGEALLWGLFFGVGPVAEQYPKLVRTDIEETPERLDAVAGAIAEVETRAPGFLDRFESAVYGGDSAVLAEVATESVRMLVQVSVNTDGSGGAVYHDPIEGLIAIGNGKPHNLHPSMLAWAAVVVAKLATA
jgi:hypothetical protein